MTLYCCIRKKGVSDTPEERVRQRCLKWMIEELGYPPGAIVVEKALRELPHLAGRPLDLPQRRLDILVCPQGQPLLLIECKADKITPQAISQVMGYAHLVGAPLVALACVDEVKTGYLNKGELTLVPGLPCYKDIC